MKGSHNSSRLINRRCEWTVRFVSLSDSGAKVTSLSAFTLDEIKRQIFLSFLETLSLSVDRPLRKILSQMTENHTKQKNKVLKDLL